jgi:RNA polymerase sigma factor (sigma-70 family)
MDAYAVLLVRHRPVLLALCRRTLGDPALAEDAVQEASLQALLNLVRLRSPERFGSWLAGIGLNLCRTWLRTRARDCWSWDAINMTIERRGPATAEQAETATRILHLVSDSGDGDPQVRAAVSDLSTCVREAVAALPRGQRAAVQLFYLSGFSYKETANLLGIEEGTVRTRLHKARSALRGSLRMLGEEENLVIEDKQTAGETTMSEERKREYTCSFCGKKNAEVHRMIAGPPPLNAAICDACITLCYQIIAEQEAKTAPQ